MQQVLLSRQQLLLAFVTNFYKRLQQTDSLVTRGKTLLETIIDKTYENEILTKRMARSQDFEKDIINESMSIIKTQITKAVCDFTVVSIRYLEDFQGLETISSNVNEYLDCIPHPTRILHEQSNPIKLPYIQDLFQLLNFISTHTDSYQLHRRRVASITTVFLQTVVNEAGQQQNTMKYNLLLWVYQPLTKDPNAFYEKYGNLQRARSLSM